MNKPDRSLNPTQRLASSLNWYKRMVMGAKGTLNIYQIRRHVIDVNLTVDQTSQLYSLFKTNDFIRELLHLQQERLEAFHKLSKAEQPKKD